MMTTLAALMGAVPLALGFGLFFFQAEDGIRDGTVTGVQTCALPISALTGAAADFSAENYDRLVDSPVEIGNFQEADFDEGGGHYRVAVDADPADYDIQKIVSTLRRLVASATEWMKDRPYQTYLFVYHFPHGPAGGGMEHAYSTAIDINANRLAENPLVLS